MKKIALTQRLIQHGDYHEMREALDIAYSKLMFEIGYLPIVLPYDVPSSHYFDAMDISGLLLTGGNDLCVCHHNDLSMKRDAFEKALLTYCIQKKIPVFGICRGMQLIAEYFGSSFKSVEHQINIHHRLIVNPNSYYADALEKLDEVNAYHNFAIDSLGQDLIASATNSEGMIKAIEHTKAPIFGQMWHSEREKPFKEAELALMKEFFGA